MAIRRARTKRFKQRKKWFCSYLNFQTLLLNATKQTHRKDAIETVQTTDTKVSSKAILNSSLNFKVVQLLMAERLQS